MFCKFLAISNSSAIACTRLAIQVARDFSRCKLLADGRPSNMFFVETTFHKQYLLPNAVSAHRIAAIPSPCTSKHSICSRTDLSCFFHGELFVGLPRSSKTSSCSSLIFLCASDRSICILRYGSSWIPSRRACELPKACALIDGIELYLK